ncbi:hypothetical protein FKW77_000341 [Venturia effusa]|uniref:Uncharacterized protein n=1 Tax=Venturia effusa TaxID=50376 RepID=A0A517LD23_9PEZI|nr:hypothetical protein FKW77_000341 [Venturia effusa]
MRLFLIRHGETVDNVAGLYAGSRDSELTNHGHLQATRLGKHFQSSSVEFTHIFSSPLKRAIKTAELIRDAQPTSIDIVQSSLIVEQDFGFYEGKPAFARPLKGNARSGKEAHRALHMNDPGFVDIEPKETMASRADAFLNKLIPAIPDKSNVIAVVSHGIMLSVLWRRYLLRLPPRTVILHPEVLAAHGRVDLKRLGGWSNTGYLELEMSVIASSLPFSPASSSVGTDGKMGVLETNNVQLATVFESEDTASELDAAGYQEDQAMPTSTVDIQATLSNRSFTAWTTTICAINHKPHLNNLKRTRGGVGSSRHDETQMSINSFFQKQSKG